MMKNKTAPLGAMALLPILPLLSLLPMTVMANEPLPQDKSASVSIDGTPSQTGWLDNHRRQFKGWLQGTAHHIDDWFGETDPNKPARASLRVIVDTTWSEKDGTTIKPRLRGKVKLPALENRLSVVFGDDNLDDEPADGGILTDSRLATANKKDDKAYDSRQAREDNSSLALRWSKFRHDTGLDVDLGVRSDDIFIRAKIGKNWQLSPDVQARFEQTYRYGSRSEHMALSTLEFAQAQSDSRAIVSRSHLHYTHKDEENLNWSSSLFQRHHWQVKRGTGELNYGLYTGGDIVDKKAHLNTYGPYISYRQPVWREWVFLQGDVSYYNNKLTQQDHNVSLFGRVEVVF
ncbi:hypothetical protein ACFBZI_02595 [Moraxella sp. ZJ142]